jgi:RNA polymerase sigma-70 factor, ECF subfamily
VSRDFRTLSDEELAACLARHGAGDCGEGPCEELFRRYRKRIYLWSHGYCHDVDEAVDLTQEIFIRIFEGIGAFGGRSRLSTWIYTIARNHCLGKLARQGDRWRKRLLTLDDLEVPDDGFADLLRQKEQEDRLNLLLNKAKSRMKDEELEAFVLHYRDGLGVKEITRVLDCENATGARTLIQNARRKFRRMTAGKEYPDG